MPSTLFDKVWDSHVVRKIKDGPDVLFIDRHFIHEVTSPVAFLSLEQRRLSVMLPEKTYATADHNTPTINQHLPVNDPLSANQLKALETNSKKVRHFAWGIGQPEERDCSCGGTRKRHNPAGHDDRLWRLPHFYSRSLWCNSFRNWYVRGGNGAFLPMHHAA